MNQPALNDGDIGLARCTWRNPLCWFFWFGGLIGAIPKQCHFHAMMVYWVPEPPVHDRALWLVEAAPPAVDNRPVTPDDITACDWYRPAATVEQKRGALKWAFDRFGEPYPRRDIIFWILEIIADWIRKLLRRERIIAMEAYKCTHLVAGAYLSQGVDLVPGVPLNRVFPDDIANSKLVEQVQP